MYMKDYEIAFSFENADSYGVTCSNLIKGYKDPASEEGVIGLRGLELQVKPGELISIIDPLAQKSQLYSIS